MEFLKKLSLVVLMASQCVAAQTKMTAGQAAVKIADRIVNSTTYMFENKKTGETYSSLKGVELSYDVAVQSKYNQWHYTNGVTHLALLELSDELKQKKYEKYVEKNMQFVFDEDNLSYFRKLYNKAFAEGGWNAVRNISWHMIFRGKRLDDNGPMGASLIELQKRYPNPAFLDYINETANHLNTSEPRLKDGTIARIWPHENTVWADDAFMAISFLSRMGSFSGDKKYFDDAANQVLKYNKYLWHEQKQIYYHCYHTDNKEHGVAHWSRANGWVFMAQADLLSRIPKNHPKRKALIENFRQQASGVARYQGKNGLWHQILDKEDSYEEITGTAMFVFGIARGVKAGWLHPDFIYVAEQGLKGILSKISPNGDVTDICVGTGIMPSLQYYYNRPTQTNDPMGEGPVLRALVEMMHAPKYTEIRAESQYDKIGNASEKDTSLMQSENYIYARRFASSELKRFPQAWQLDYGKQLYFGYTQGLGCLAMLKMWKATGENHYYEYVKAWADSLINDKGEIHLYKADAYNIDFINSGKVLFDIYKQTGDPKYKLAMDRLIDQLNRHPRTSEGGYWHKKIYPNQIWLDGIYMGSPFMAQYGRDFNEPRWTDEAIHQVTLCYKQTYDAKTGLNYHAWDESKLQTWANKETGHSPNFWGRSIGWFFMATVDVLDYVPENHPRRGELITIVQNLTKAMARYQSKNGLWYQVVDMPDREGNYEEASVSAMCMYAIAKAANKGYIDDKYKQIAQKAFEGIKTGLITENPDGTLSLTRCCAVAGLGGNPYRDGSYQYYISEKIRDNDAKATGPFIMGCLELER